MPRSPLQYADDTQVLVSGKKQDMSNLITRMESALATLFHWFYRNGMKVNSQINSDDCPWHSSDAPMLRSISFEVGVTAEARISYPEPESVPLKNLPVLHP